MRRDALASALVAAHWHLQTNSEQASEVLAALGGHEISAVLPPARPWGHDLVKLAPQTLALALALALALSLTETNSNSVSGPEFERPADPIFNTWYSRRTLRSARSSWKKFQFSVSRRRCRCCKP